MANGSQPQPTPSEGGSGFLHKLLVSVISTAITGVLGWIGLLIVAKVQEDFCATKLAEIRLSGRGSAPFYCWPTPNDMIEKAMARLKSKDGPKAPPSPEQPKAEARAPTQPPAAAPPPAEVKAAEPPPAPAPKIAARTSEPPSPPPTPVSPVDKACPQRSLPRSATAPVTIEQSLCALAACAQGAAVDNPDLELLLDWRALQRKLELEPCRSADRDALSDLKSFARVRDAISAVPIPSADGGEAAIEAREVCRGLQNRLTRELEAARLKLRPIDGPPPSCPKIASNISREVQAFLDRRGFR